MKVEIAILEFKSSEPKPWQVFVTEATVNENCSFIEHGNRTRYMFSSNNERIDFLMEEDNLDLVVAISGTTVPNYRHNVNQINIS